MHFSRTKLTQVGDTIVEVMLALTILSLVLGAASVLVNQTTRSMTSTQEHSSALRIAQSQVEYIKAYAAAHTDELASATSTIRSGQFCMIKATPPSTGYVPVGITSPNCIIDASGNATTNEPGYKMVLSIQKLPSSSDGYNIRANIQWTGLNVSNENVDVTYRIYQKLTANINAANVAAPSPPPSPPPTAILPCPTPTFIALALDQSGSMTQPFGSGQRVDAVQAAGTALVNAAGIGPGTLQNKASVSLWSGWNVAPSTPQPMSGSVSAIDSAVNGYTIPSGSRGTNIGTGIMQAYAQLIYQNRSFNRIIVIVTDGRQDEAPDSDAFNAATLVASDGVLVYAVGVALDAPAKSFLDQVARLGGTGSAVNASSPAQLTTLERAIGASLKCP